MNDAKSDRPSKVAVADGPSTEMDASRRREIIRLTAALVTFGAAMGIDVGTGHAIEIKLNDVIVTSKNGQTAAPGKGTSLELKRNETTQKAKRGTDKIPKK